MINPIISEIYGLQLNPDNSNYRASDEIVRVIRFSSYPIYWKETKKFNKFS